MSAASEHYTIAIVDFTGKLGRGPLPPPFTSTEANCSARRITPMHAVKKGVKPMAKYILLVNWTDQGIRNIKDSAKRLDAGRALAKEQGCVLESFFMTMGSFDNVAVVEAPDDETIAKYVLTLGSEGNLRTVTLKAVPEETYRTIIGELA
jgi:uncharacterized protein with GYD domain